MPDKPSPRLNDKLPQPLALFPLNMVLFPGALLGLKVFETRYLDLMSACMRSGQPFGVVCIRAGGAEVGRTDKPLQMETVGVLAHIDDIDAEQPGILNVRCIGGERFRITEPAVQRDDGLWLALAEPVAKDAARAPGPAMMQTVDALSEAIRKLQAQEHSPFLEPYRTDDAGWVANRWAELLPIPLAAKQKLMALEDPTIRLSLVDGFLRDKKVVFG